MVKSRSLALALTLGAGVGSYRSLVAAPIQEFTSRAEVSKPTRLWTEPTKFGEAIAALEPGLKIQVRNYSTSGSWLKVVTPAGREGWVPVRHTNLGDNREYKGKTVKLGSDGKRMPASVDPVVDAAISPAESGGKYVSGSVEYANQISVGKAHGFGMGLTGGYFLKPVFAPGLWVSFNRFSETVADASYSVKRSAQRYFVGPNARFQKGHFAADVSIGVDIIKSSFTIKDLITGGVVNTACSGSSSESSIGFNIRPSYRFPMGATTLLELYTAYGIGLHGGDSCVPNEKGSAPQQMSLGVAIHTPL